MCGIAGIIGPRATLAIAKAARPHLIHRGPDGSGEFVAPGFACVHTRLSIIDTSDSGSQPMSVPGCGTIAFNGEIFDYIEQRDSLRRKGVRFETESDTEVLVRGLACAGTPFLSTLHAMYAFAWLSPDGQTAWLGRDHVGIKPLYYFNSEHDFVFGSEIRAVAAVLAAVGIRPRLSGDALVKLLHRGHIPEPETVIEGVRAVPQDSVLKVETRSGRLQEVIEVGTQSFQTSVSPGAGLQRYVHDAVRRHTRSDVPTALFLSGGLDSNVIASELAETTPRPAAVTVVLGQDLNSAEVREAAEGAAGAKLEHYIVPATNWLDRLGTVIDAFDQPSVDGINTFIVSGVAKDLGFKVALSGLGGDEVFGGYKHFHEPGLLRATLGSPAIRSWATRSAYRWPHPRLLRLSSLTTSAGSSSAFHLAWRELFPETILSSLLRGLLSGRRLVGGAIPDHERLDVLELERATYLRNQLLRDSDVMGMANGVEIRVPFLDPQVLYPAANLGSDFFIQTKRPAKWFLREGWKGRIPRSVIAGRKRGFAVDLNLWLAGPARQMTDDALRRLESSGLFDVPTLRRLWYFYYQRVLAGSPNAWVRVFALLQVSETLKRWGDPVQNLECM